ncbi:hypothetical protein T439DRAFT_322056 [Meredithblackwellia eburnea MCA 4105]
MNNEGMQTSGIWEEKVEVKEGARYKVSGSPIAAINRLPPELLSSILQLSLEGGRERTNQDLLYLSGASKVCRRWKRPAQYVLGSELVLDQRTAPMWLKSESYTLSEPKHITMVKVDRYMLQEVLQVCTCVTSLTLDGEPNSTRLGWDIFRLPQLTSLRSLRLLGYRFAEPACGNTSPLNVALESLELSFDHVTRRENQPPSPTFYEALFRGAGQSLRRLDLVSTTPSAVARSDLELVRKALPILSDSLQHMTFKNFTMIPYLQHAVASLKHLHTLDFIVPCTGGWELAVFGSLPEGQLRHLKVANFAWWWLVNQPLTSIIRNWPTLSKLETLQIDFRGMGRESDIGYTAHLNNLRLLFDIAEEKEIELTVIGGDGSRVFRETLADPQHWQCLFASLNATY